MDYRKLKSAYDQSLAAWNGHVQEAQKTVETIYREFLYYLGIREEEHLLSIVPFHPEDMFDKTPSSPAESLAIGEEGQAGAALRLVLGEDAYIFRFELTKDNECWVLKPLGEKEEFTLPEDAGKEDKDDLHNFFAFLTDSLADSIDEELDLWSTERERKPRAIGFILDEKLIKARLPALEKKEVFSV